MPPSSFVTTYALERNINYTCDYLSVCLVFLLIISTSNPGVQSSLSFQVYFRNRYLPRLATPAADLVKATAVDTPPVSEATDEMLWKETRQIFFLLRRIKGHFNFKILSF